MNEWYIFHGRFLTCHAIPCVRSKNNNTTLLLNLLKACQALFRPGLGVPVVVITDQLNYLLNSDGPIVKTVARFFYLANLMHSSVNMN